MRLYDGVVRAFGAVLALFGNEGGSIRQNERSQVVDVALYDMAFRMIGPLLTYFDATGQAWHRDGNHSLAGAPTGHFQSKEGDWLCVSVQNDEQFARCARLVGRVEWTEDDRFSTLENRTKHREIINVEVAKWVAERSRSATLTAFEQAGLPAGPINSIVDMAADAHIASRGVKRVIDPALGEVRVPDVVPCLSESPGYADRPAPRARRASAPSSLRIARLLAGATGEPGKRGSDTSSRQRISPRLSPISITRTKSQRC
jgi:crotonobetainyl-CoA:carnitine CoA-transferase CaiB-like acyl-CoA transferase